MAKKEQEGSERMQGAETSCNQARHQMWRVLWSLNVNHKIKIFIWKRLKDVVPVKELIYRRLMKGDPICSGCGEDVETLEHMLLECNRVKEIWKLAPVQWDGIQDVTRNSEVAGSSLPGCCWERDCWPNQQHPSDPGSKGLTAQPVAPRGAAPHAGRAWNITTWWTALSEAKHRVQGMEHIALTAYILWQIWKCRNNRKFNNKVQEPMQVINKAWNAWMEFNNGVKEARKCSISKTTVPPQTNGQEVRQNLENRPRGMHIRIATSWNKETKFIGYGIIAANSRGQDVIGWKMRERASESQLQQRVEGVKWALIKAAEQRWRLVCIEVPGKDLLQQIQGSKTANMWIATLINDIRELSTMFYKCSFCLGKYNRNDLSCLFSAQALSNYHDLEWVNPNLLY
ncbi:uncharacterized protein [Coffea arabica]|uniref:Reverse transcriptase zinc-binding domain-containing protein n=1 Tax=Coffea arabica TaxID=13443 RepID=A0ABM4UYC5_COFAR